jgi:hypothetical protein
LCWPDDMIEFFDRLFEKFKHGSIERKIMRGRLYEKGRDSQKKWKQFWFSFFESISILS